MKVNSSSTLPLVLVLVACCYSSPMFGTGGMMKRKFPGAPEMSYQTYREIANSNAAAAASGGAARAGGAVVAPRAGGSNSGDTAWMFGNEVDSSSTSTSSNQPGSTTQTGLSFNQHQPSFNQQQPSFNQQTPSSPQHRRPFYPQDSYDSFQGRYPSVWEPQDSYMFVQFPYLDYDDDFVPQKKVSRHSY